MIILYDGVCLLCNRFVQFVVRRTSPADCRFAPLQEIPLFAQKQDSVWVQTYAGDWLSESDAVLYILGSLSGYGWTRLGKYIPRPWRNAVYQWVARHRYGWFGQSPTCLMPEPGRMLSSEEIRNLQNQL